MRGIFLLVAVLLPIAGSLPALLPWKRQKGILWYLELIVCITSLLIWGLLFNRPQEILHVVSFTGDLEIALEMDGLSMVFAGLLATLWPLAMLYSFSYMKHEERAKGFFLFYTMTYGVTLGISLAGNLLTMYFFYELLTLVTVPLVMHTQTAEAIYASRKYLYYSLGGAAFAFIGLIFIIVYGSSMDFVYGGVLDLAKVGDRADTLLLIYVIAFCGFGVKAAIYPFHGWLSRASVAHTPVTALLHAVAVVKSGAFAIIRMTYYSFGTDFLRGTWAQTVVMILAIVSILYGSSRAVKERHVKRRLAYSTTGNLSYILFGVTMMTPLGLLGALCHMVFHAVMKIGSFFCIGAVMHGTGRSYVYEMDGLAEKMPKVFACFTVTALGLMGVPGLAGFISKWQLAGAAIDSGGTLAFVGVGALLVSALLTAIYMLTIVIRAYFPGKDFDESTLKGIQDADALMWVPLVIFAVGTVVLGLHSQPLVAFLRNVALGLL